MFESTIEETDINSSIETIDKIAGGRAVHDNTAGAIVADRDKTAREAEAIHDKIAEEVADDNTIDPFVELAVLEAADRIDEEADEDIVEEIVINSSIEANIDNTVDPFIELVVLAADRVGEEAGEDIIEKLSSIQVLRRLLIILSIH